MGASIGGRAASSSNALPPPSPAVAEPLRPCAQTRGARWVNAVEALRRSVELGPAKWPCRGRRSVEAMVKRRPTERVSDLEPAKALAEIARRWRRRCPHRPALWRPETPCHPEAGEAGLATPRVQSCPASGDGESGVRGVKRPSAPCGPGGSARVVENWRTGPPSPPGNLGVAEVAAQKVCLRLRRLPPGRALEAASGCGLPSPSGSPAKPAIRIRQQKRRLGSGERRQREKRLR